MVGRTKSLRYLVVAAVIILVFLKATSHNPTHDLRSVSKSFGLDLASVDFSNYRALGSLGGLGKTTPVAQRENATFVTLARNEDLWGIVSSIREVEDRFNGRYHYDWVFLNDVEFNDEFKKITTEFVSGNTFYGKIPKEHWSYPAHIDKQKAYDARQQMIADKIIYGGSESYRHMCRFESGFFWRHPLVTKYQYYWRVEPHIKLTCDIPEDPFRFMRENDKMYGFTISLYEYESTIKTLWATTKKFMEKYPELLAKDNSLGFISDDNGKTYNNCHFWSNFEIANLDLWRSKPYATYFDFLDQEGGFFYERWGDAPVHSIGAALFARKDQIHFFDNIGYWHVPFQSCPLSQSDRMKYKCTCPNEQSIEPNQRNIFTMSGYSCTPRFFKFNNMELPEGWDENQ